MATAPVEAIADAEAFGTYLEKSETILVVMDVHQNWCGPCDTMKPTYNSIFQRDRRLREQGRVYDRGHQNINAAARRAHGDEALDLDLANHGCMPFFLLVKNKAVVAIVLGADVPTSEDNVVLYAPEDEAAE